VKGYWEGFPFTPTWMVLRRNAPVLHLTTFRHYAKIREDWSYKNSLKNTFPVVNTETSVTV
jgi:hypothetical protein